MDVYNMYMYKCADDYEFLWNKIQNRVVYEFIMCTCIDLKIQPSYWTK